MHSWSLPNSNSQTSEGMEQPPSQPLKCAIAEALRDPLSLQKIKQKGQLRGCLPWAAEVWTRYDQGGSRMEGTRRDVQSSKAIKNFWAHLIYLFILGGKADERDELT